MLTTKPLKQKKCKHCKSVFMPTKRLQNVCGAMCGLERARIKREAAAKKADRADTKQRKEAIETIPQLIKRADKAFAAFIRERDRLAGHLCISSGQPLNWSTANQVDAGHYRSKGAASHLRYNEDNCHAQTKQQNRFKAGNAVDYRVHLIDRIGLARVEALECDNEVVKWDRDVLRQIIVIYRAKLRELKKGQA
jgi:hypothetical protein